MTAVMRRGLYHSYIITSQSYSVARLISGSNGFNELDAAAEPADDTTGTECYTGGDASFYTTNYRQ